MRDQPEWVTVTDPAHPLFQRDFALVAISGSALSGRALVAYRGDVVLKLPIGATSLGPALPRPPSSKLSLAAIRDLVRLAMSGEVRTSRAAVVEPATAEQVESKAETASVTSPRTTGEAP